MVSSTDAAGGTLRSVDPVWEDIRQDAQRIIASDPAMASFVFGTVLNHARLEDAIVQRIAERLENSVVSAEVIRRGFEDAMSEDASISEAMRIDLAAVYDRDPACSRYIEPVLYFKGFHALQAYRLSHWMWHQGRKDFALYLQSRSSEVFQTDINPAARIGKGIFLDHATGLVVGATAAVEDDVSILTTRSPLRINGARAKADRAAPRVGENGDAIREEFGL